MACSKGNKANNRLKSNSRANLSLLVNNQPKKLCQWSADSMERALEAVVTGKMRVNRAALEFNVPRTTEYHGLKMNTISLQTKATCSDSKSFILITFHLVSNNCVHVVYALLYVLLVF